LAFKKIRYNTGEEIVKIKIIDGTRKLIENWVLMMSDLPAWFRIMKLRYGLKDDKKDLNWAI